MSRFSTATPEAEHDPREALMPAGPALPLWKALFFFGIPACLFRLSLYGGFPLLEASGLGPFPTLWLTFMAPLLILLAASLFWYRRDGYAWNAATFCARFRLRRMDGRAWLWTIGGFLVGYLASGAFLPVGQVLARIPALAPPAFLPVYLTPFYTPSLTPTTFLGITLYGNWLFLGAYLLLLLGNIVGEEFWWRGYLFPRQELTHGRWTWLIHGILWTLFHAPVYPWNLLTLLPMCLAISFVAQRTRNTWPGLLMHFTNNGLILIPLLLGVLGVGR